MNLTGRVFTEIFAERSDSAFQSARGIASRTAALFQRTIITVNLAAELRIFCTPQRTPSFAVQNTEPGGFLARTESRTVIEALFAAEF